MNTAYKVLTKTASRGLARLESAYPGSVAAYRIWYNDPLALTEGKRSA